MDNTVFDRLRSAKVDWEPAKDGESVFVAAFDGKLVYLRLNEFPAEPLCTLIVDGLEADLEDFPASWTLPGHREGSCS
jgi:hypothetical protein